MRAGNIQPRTDRRRHRRFDQAHLANQNTFFVTNSGVQNRLETNRQPRTLVTNSYIEGDVDIVSGRGAVVFDNTEFRVVNSRTQQEAYVFAPATLSNIYYGFLAVNSRFNALYDCSGTEE